MNISSDFRDLLHALSAARVRFLVVGGYAVIHHTEPRFTKDLDVWVDRTAANAARVVRALQAFGAPTDSLSTKDFQEPNIIYQIGVAPVRVDILTSVTGLEFASAFRHSETVTYAGVAARVLSLQDILTAKKAAGRPQDMLDAEKLERAIARAQVAVAAEKAPSLEAGAKPARQRSLTVGKKRKSP